MQIKEVITLISAGSYPASKEWQEQRARIHAAIRSTVWPVGSDKFTIHAQSGKKSGEGNGVKPIKAMTIDALTNKQLASYSKLRKAKNLPESPCWVTEVPFPPLPHLAAPKPKLKKGDPKPPRESKPGNIDLAYICGEGLICFEWETGNISSSHRSLNKLALGLMRGDLKAGVLVVPSRAMYKYLTDRVGNVDELRWYFPLWAETPCKDGVLEVIVIEQDDESDKVPRIPKGTDGLAAYGAAQAEVVKV